MARWGLHQHAITDSLMPTTARKLQGPSSKDQRRPKHQ